MSRNSTHLRQARARVEERCVALEQADEALKLAQLDVNVTQVELSLTAKGASKPRPPTWGDLRLCGAIGRLLACRRRQRKAMKALLDANEAVVEALIAFDLREQGTQTQC